MSARTGLGRVEVALLEAFDAVGAVPGAARRRSTAVLDELERTEGLGARYAYRMLVDLAVPWRVHLPLVEGYGNFGSPGNDPAADPRYTECRLSEVGALALAAERGDVGPVPLGLIEGTLYRDGVVPPFDPGEVVEALRRRESGAKLEVPRPSLPTGGAVEGRVPTLLAGRPARLTLACRIVDEPGRLVITRVPLGVSPDEVMLQIANAVTAHRHRRTRPPGYLSPAAVRSLRPSPPPPVRDVREERRGGTAQCIVVVLEPDADPVDARRWLRSIWPVTVQVDCRLPAPMAERLATWDARDGSGLAALGTLLGGPAAGT